MNHLFSQPSNVFWPSPTNHLFNIQSRKSDNDLTSMDCTEITYSDEHWATSLPIIESCDAEMIDRYCTPIKGQKRKFSQLDPDIYTPEKYWDLKIKKSPISGRNIAHIDFTPSAKERVARSQHEEGWIYVIARKIIEVNPLNGEEKLVRIERKIGKTANFFSRMSKHISDVNAKQGDRRDALLAREIRNWVESQLMNELTPNQMVKWSVGVFPRRDGITLSEQEDEAIIVKNSLRTKDGLNFNQRRGGGGGYSKKVYTKLHKGSNVPQQKIAYAFEMPDTTYPILYDEKKGRYTADMPRTAKGIEDVLYGFFDPDSKKCLYVGQTSGPAGKRLREHVYSFNHPEKTKGQGPLPTMIRNGCSIAFAILHRFNSEDDRDEAEKQGIQQFAPLCNRNKGGGGGIAEPRRKIRKLDL